MKLTKKQAQQYSLHLVRDGKLVAIFLVSGYQSEDSPILAPINLGNAIIKALETHAGIVPFAAEKGSKRGEKWRKS